MKVEVAVLGSLPVPNNPYGLCGRKATLNSKEYTQSCVKVEVAVLDSPSLIILTVSLCARKATWNLKGYAQSSGAVWKSTEVDVLGPPYLIILTMCVDVKQPWTWRNILRARELCESRGGRPGLPVPMYESRGGRPGIPVPNNPYGLCGTQSSLELEQWALLSAPVCPDATLCGWRHVKNPVTSRSRRAARG